MKVVYDYVPEDMCILDYLAGLGERIKNAWIFCDNDCFEQMNKQADKSIVDEGLPYCFHWDAVAGQYPSTDVMICRGRSWNSFVSIKADDIAFKMKADDPEEIFFLKMKKVV